MPGPPAADGGTPATRVLEFEFGTYEGEVSATSGRRHGWGKLRYNSGNTYEGAWVDGVAHGTGIKLYRNGDMYSGEWVAGQREGRGKYRFAQGHHYVGDYKDDQCHGAGVLATKQGDVYDGAWEGGRKHGAGTERLASGQVFEGTWSRGKKHGVGTTTTPSGEVVKGRWEADCCIEVLSRTAPPPAAPEPLQSAGGVAELAPAPTALTPELEAQLAAAGLTPEVLAAMMGQMNVVNSAVTGQLDSLAGGIDRMEAQLHALTSALDLSGDEDWDEDGRDAQGGDV